MDPISGDSRFSKLAKDKKFLSVAKKHKKVKIDKRFESLFTNEKFVSKCTVDKRGRPKSLSSKESYEKFYDLEDSDSSESDDAGQDIDKSSDEEESSKPPTNDDEDTVLESDIKSKLLSSNVDYARGEADLYSDSSSEEDTDSEEEGGEQDDEEPEMFDKWGELDHEAERTEDATDRLAVCNMDWDRVGADDIFLVLSSFCPVGGSVSSVHVYLSDFGRERLEEEKTLGPKELRQFRGEQDDDDDVEVLVDKNKAVKEAAAAMDRVRQYQVARLKYYYAVVIFDSLETASHVYTECDGMEYELSATRIDLRFIPQEMTFSTPSSSCLAPPHPDKYQPKTFFTTALQQGKVELTWDEEDQNRAKAIKEACTKMGEGEDIENMGDLIASASEDEEDGEKEQGSEIEGENDKDAINKYRALLVGIGGNNEKPAEGDMEVTWNDEDNTEDQEELTPWEKYLKKKKEKKKKKPEAIDNGADDVPEGVDMNDPFFAEEFGKEEQIKKKDKKKKNKNKEINDIDNEEGDDKLALMVMDSDDEKDHFNFKDIVESESKTGKSKKKWKKKKKELEIPSEDNFNVDVTDDRFSALFNRPEFNIDPTEPGFKKTKNMEKIIGEKQKRIGQKVNTGSSEAGKKQKLDPEVSSSLKSVKNKWKKNAKKIKPT